MDGKLVLVDGHSILNRAFFGIPDLTNSEGLHTNAVYGFLNILFKILDEEQPDYLTVAFDVHAPTFRHKMYDAYKGTRKPMAEELRQQVPLMKEMLTAMGVTIVEKEGYEADDLLGTIAKQSEAQGLEVSIVSGDRDLLQLASDHIKIRIPKTKRTGTEIEDYLAKDVVEKYQVTPLQFIDVKALMGDSADNIPGVPGIGEKTATALIVSYGSIENAHDHLEEIKPNRAKQNLSEHYDMAQMSKELATIEIHAPIEYSLEDAKLGNLFTEEAYLMCKRLEFKNMLSRFDIDAPKNLAEEHFTFVTDKKQISDIFKKAKKAGHIGCCLLPGEGIITEQLSLFEQPKEQQVIEGMSIAFSEEDIYYLSAGTEVSAEELLEEIRELSEMLNAVRNFRRLLKQTELNPREFLFEQLPNAMNASKDRMTGRLVQEMKQSMDAHFENAIEDTAKEMKKIFGAKESDSLKACLLDWYSGQKNRSKRYVLNKKIKNFMEYVGELNTNDEREIVAVLSKRLEDIYIEDWNDRLQEKFLRDITKIRQKTEAAKEDAGLENGQKEIFLKTADGAEIHKYYDADVKDSTSEFLKNMIEEALDNFGDSLETNQKVAVLAEALEKLLQ